MQFRCDACEYAYELDQQLRKPARLNRKVIDDIISLEDVMKNAPQTKGAVLDAGHGCFNGSHRSHADERKTACLGRRSLANMLKVGWKLRMV